MIGLIMTCAVCAAICYMIDEKPASAIWGVALGPIGVLIVLASKGEK